MSPDSNIVAVALIAIGSIAAARLVWKRPQRWPLRLLLQSLAVFLFYFVLDPPLQVLPRAGALTVLGAGWHDALHPSRRMGMSPAESQAARSAETSKGDRPEGDVDASAGAALVGQDPSYAVAAEALAGSGHAEEVGSDRARITLGPISAVIALPEAEDPLPPGVRRAPDLASALRLRPQFSALRVFGRGLSLRDLDAVRGRVVEFVAASIPRGFIAVEHTDRVALGASIRVTARWSGPDPARIQLLDAAGEVLAEQAIDAQASARDATARGPIAPKHDPADSADPPGASTQVDATPASPPAAGTDHTTPLVIADLRTPARAPGALALRLRALDADDRLLDEHALHVDIAPPHASKTLLLAAAPGPETRALRRWAVDAGLDFDSRIQFAPGLVQGGRALAPSAEELTALDLLIIEERAWSALGAGGRAAVLAEVGNGLGLLLRLTALPNPGLLAELREAGFHVQRIAGETTAQTRLPGAPTRLRRLPIRVDASQAVNAVRGDDGDALALWRTRGLGRFGLLWLTDSYRLQAAGHGEVYGLLWSDLAGALARAPAAAPGRPTVRLPRGQMQAWAGERIELCDLRGSAVLSTPSGETLALAAPDAHGCAAALPRRAGTYRSGEDPASMLRFEVLEPDGRPALHAADLRTRMFAAMTAPNAERAEGPLAVAGDFKPWLAALLIVLAALWWLERPRAPRAGAP